jgi:7-cyano-7-deazaguanine synthase in queuosine biosynthesis
VGAHATEVRLESFADVDHCLGGIVTSLQELGLQPSERALDLAILAAAVTAADTRIERSIESQDGWTREIELCVPVLAPKLWTQISPLLTKTLNFLTGDRWELTFRARARSVMELIPPSTGQLTDRPTTVCLFSGGLDSFIGAVDLLAENQKVLLISHYWDSVTSSHQSICLEALSNRFPDADLYSIQARVGFPTGTVEGSFGENTLRARSFLFFSLAALAADAIGGEITIHVPENGLISLNVPLDPLRLGSLSTRTTHPYYMSRFDEILGELGLESTLNNAYRHMTKGEMVAACADQKFLRKQARNTISCSSPAKARFNKDENRRHPKNCGHCVPCLIRRAALVHGFGEDDTEYQLEDLGAQVLDSRSAEGEHVRSFQLAISRLREKPGRARFDIHKPGPLIDFPDDWDEYETVYRDGLEEVGRLIEDVESRPLD